MTEISQFTLSNHTRVVVESNPGVQSAAMVWLLPAGVATDSPVRVGRAAMWSELLLRGAGDLDSRDQADFFDRLGASRSTTVSSRFLSVGATVLGSRLLETIPLLADMVCRPRFDDSAIEPTRQLCTQAIEALQDEPGDLAALGARGRHLSSPFNRSTLGEMEGLKALTADELRQQWPSAATASGSIITVSGLVDPPALIERLEELLAAWQGEAAEPTPTAEPARGYDHIEDETNQVQIVLMHDAPAAPSAEAVLERLAVRVLSGGMSSRLFTEVREKRGLCYSVGARYSADRDFGLVSAAVGTQPDRAQESLDVLVAEMQRLGTPEGKVTPEEFGRAVAGLKSGVIFSGESTEARASALAGDLFRLGRPRSLAEIAAEIDAVSLEQLNAYVATRKMGRVTVQTLGPEALVVPSSIG
ncbi:MAG: pitrilysin family protein [Planctomycetota bacterium]|nr:pitrilysin family protein [Planctomycetota bacterium]